MSSLITVAPDFDLSWPFAADHFHQLWQEEEVQFIRLEHGDDRKLGQITPDTTGIKRLACLGVTVRLDCLMTFTDIKLNGQDNF